MTHTDVQTIEFADRAHPPDEGQNIHGLRAGSIKCGLFGRVGMHQWFTYQFNFIFRYIWKFCLFYCLSIGPQVLYRIVVSLDLAVDLVCKSSVHEPLLDCRIRVQKE